MPANDRLKGPTSQTICSAESTLSPSTSAVESASTVTDLKPAPFRISFT